ncbi:serine/threonine-protein kinase [Sorangium sp. So ce861]|uniref:serine/threonine-protein kinase n=1 Tax=Sorangium sp. So ce861 TaxID=3133323 RepID=UPI003F638B23
MRVGDVLEGRFTLDARAGSGGMGEVFRARDRDTGQAVAVKVMLARHAGDRARFEREVRVLSELRHPAIVQFVAHGQTPDGEPYLAMEWLEGEDLRARLARGMLGVDESVALAARVAAALGTAHARGVVHRDLKPSNLFLPAGDVALVKVLDFGIAHLGDVTRLTRTGSARRTPSCWCSTICTGPITRPCGWSTPPCGSRRTCRSWCSRRRGRRSTSDSRAAGPSASSRRSGSGR